MTTINYFQNIETLTELKKQYFSLAKQYHPDINKDPSSTETMQQINNQYEKMFTILKSTIDYTNKDSYKQNNYTCKQESNTDFINIINKIIHLENITVEIIGYYIWVYGETKPYKDYLKENNFKWCNGKKCWNIVPEGYARIRTNKFNSFDDLRSKYGSRIINSIRSNKLNPELV